MTPEPAPAKPARDHLWVLVVIAAFALFDIWEAWAQVGDKSGFAVGHTGTGWTLTVIVEAAAGYFLFAWFSAPGRRSRRFAMWSAFAALTLSFIGQGASSFAARAQLPPWLAVFVKDLPVVVLALIAVLIHMRRLDREDAAEAVRQDAKDTEIAALRAELETLRRARSGDLEALASNLEAERATRSEVEHRAAEAEAKAEVLAQKLARISGRKPTRKSPPKKASASIQNKTATSPPEVQVPEDVDTQAAALEILANEPDISGSALGRRLGKSERYGCMLKNQLTGSIAGPDSGGGQP